MNLQPHPLLRWEVLTLHELKFWGLKLLLEKRNPLVSLPLYETLVKESECIPWPSNSPSMALGIGFMHTCLAH